MEYPTYFEQLLSVQPASDLQRIAKLWGGAGNTRKEVALEIIRNGINTPKHVAAFIERLEPVERAALGFLKMQPSKSAHASGLAMALLSAGYPLPPTSTPYESVLGVITRMLTHSGLALVQPDRYGYSYSSMYGSDPVLVSDARLLESVPYFQVVPFVGQPISAPQDHRMRRPTQVVLDLVSLIEAIRTMGGLQINKNGTLRVSDYRKLVKAQGWDAAWMSFDGLRFYEPIIALLQMLSGMEALVYEGDRLVAGDDKLVSMPYEQILRLAVSSFPNTIIWFEYEAYAGDHMRIAAAMLRIGLISLLRRLVSVESFVAFKDVSRAFFDSVGQSFSLLGITPRVARPWNLTQQPPPRRGQSAQPVDLAAVEATWREQQWKEWQKHEEKWLAHSLTGWLYFLGLIEVSMDGNQFAALRLSDIARTVFDPTRIQQRSQQPSGPAWVVQPNFEITAYLELVTPPQIMALERAAERIQSDVHTATYRLTRESVARWLNKAETLDQLLTLLGTSTPQNVVTTVRDWAGQFERITLRRKISLLEYPTSTARDSALLKGISGKPLGEHFILFDPHAPTPKAIRQVIDYTQAPSSSLKAHEDGLVTLVQTMPDLVGRTLMNRWGEATSTGWRLTAASVANAAQKGYRTDELIQMIEQRSGGRSVPTLLKITLKGWSGSQPNLALGEVVVIEFPDQETADAIAAGKRFVGLLEQRLGPTSFRIRRADHASLLTALAEIGIIPQSLSGA